MKDFSFEKCEPLLSLFDRTYSKWYYKATRFVECVAGVIVGVVLMVAGWSDSFGDNSLLFVIGFAGGFLASVIVIAFLELGFGDYGNEYMELNTDYRTYYGFEYRTWFSVFGKPAFTSDCRGCKYLFDVKDYKKYNSNVETVVDLNNKILEIKGDKLYIKSA